MITVTITLFKGLIGTSIFLLAALVCFAFIYFIMTQESKLRRMWLRIISGAVATALVDVIWSVYRFGDIEYFETFSVGERLFIDFAAAGVIFTYAIALVNTAGNTRRRKLRVVLLVALGILMVWSLFNLVAGGIYDVTLLLPKTDVVETSLYLNTGIAVLIFIFGVIAATEKEASHHKRVMTVVLGTMVAFMGVVCVFLTVRDMGYCIFCSEYIEAFFLNGWSWLGL